MPPVLINERSEITPPPQAAYSCFWKIPFWCCLWYTPNCMRLGSGGYAGWRNLLWIPRRRDQQEKEGLCKKKPSASQKRYL